MLLECVINRIPPSSSRHAIEKADFPRENLFAKKTKICPNQGYLPELTSPPIGPARVLLA